LSSQRPPAGLCDGCVHQKLIGNTRGSTFSMCERSKTDKRFPKYPRIPVGACPGFEPPSGARPYESGSGDSTM
jgi:hypothetical protein